MAGSIEDKLMTYLCDRIIGSSTSGLQWAEGMPDDDPYAEPLVIDADGQEYEISIFVSATETSPEARQAVLDRLNATRRPTETIQSPLL